MKFEQTILLTDACSILEARLFNLKLSFDITNCDFIANPSYSYLINKVIIFSLPSIFNIYALSKTNKLVSRFPINTKEIELIPYKLPKIRIKVPHNQYSLKILNTELMSNFDHISEVNNSNYLLGVNTEIDGYLTAIGYKIAMNDLDEFEGD